MRVLFISNLFPDAAEPGRGIYNARLLAHLSKRCEVRVVSPRPTLPLFGRKPRQPRAEDRDLKPEFPPAWYLPKIGSRWNHRLMERCLRGPVEELRRAFPFDTVLASWAYPDGCAVARLAARLRFPFTVIAQGTDVHQYLRNPVRRRIIVTELKNARTVIARSGELSRLLREAGLPADRLQVIYNGVDFDVFQPGDARAARKELGLPADAAIVLYVGNFLPIKNPLLLVKAFAQLKERRSGRQASLVMLGDGPLASDARRLADSSTSRESVLLVGRKPALQVARYLQAADVLCVPSDDEGVPNVVLEAFACGLRVVATRVGGVPEIVNQDFLGRLVERRNLPALVIALSETLAESPEPERILQRSRQFSWERTAAAYMDVLGQ